jgi:hypothetical protein
MNKKSTNQHSLTLLVTGQSINSRSRSRDSSSEDDNKRKSSLEKINYNHVNLNKTKSPKNYQSLQKI